MIERPSKKTEHDSRSPFSALPKFNVEVGGYHHSNALKAALEIEDFEFKDPAAEKMLKAIPLVNPRDLADSELILASQQDLLLSKNDVSEGFFLAAEGKFGLELCEPLHALECLRTGQLPTDESPIYVAMSALGNESIFAFYENQISAVSSDYINRSGANDRWLFLAPENSLDSN